MPLVNRRSCRVPWVRLRPRFAGLALTVLLLALPTQAQEHAHHDMPGLLGPQPMTGEGSGTSWQPTSSPMDGIHVMTATWMLMIHGSGFLAFDHQGGPRGDDDVLGPAMGMLMAQRPIAGGTLGLRVMLSPDPASVGTRGYPLLLQTGEALDDRPLIDRQHPHDLFMELAASWSHPIAGHRGSVFFYAGLPGEPALGPPTFMHRFSGMEHPEAPIAHHWLDSTHITYGVVTGGLTWRGLKLDASAFRGREPDQRRWGIEAPKLDSFSGRVQVNLGPRWSLQASAGHLHSPEELEPDTNTWRATASAAYNRPLAEGNWQTTLAWGRNDRSEQNAQDAFLLESALRRGRHTCFARAEHAAKDELFAEEPASHQVFGVARMSLGYTFDAVRQHHVTVGLGGMVSLIAVPGALEPSYGGQPTSFLVFARAALR